MPSPISHLPRISLGLTFSEAQLARIEEMIERYNEIHTAQGGEPMRNYEQCIFGGLIALEALLFDLRSPGAISVFEERP